jgi:hypothetical protein
MTVIVLLNFPGYGTLNMVDMVMFILPYRSNVLYFYAMCNIYFEFRFAVCVSNFCPGLK